MSGGARQTVVRYGLGLIVGVAAGVIALASGASAQGRKHAALVVDANTGRVISESGADEPRYPASLTKMMTLYVVFDLIQRGRLSYDTKITFSETAVRVPPTKLGVPAGDSIPLLEAAKALIVKSANDASVALAEHIAGSEAKFAILMTETARRIGMTSSRFKNAHGLPDPEQVTTARDMITLGLRLQDDFPQHYKLFASREIAHRGETIRTHNTLLLTYEGTDGIKTGYIGASGFNLVANVRRGDKHVIGVVFGGQTAGARNATMKTLLNLALFKASSTKTRVVTPVARARPAPVPKPMAATRPQTVMPPAPTIVAAAAPQVLPQATSPAAADPAIQLARVRPLMVTPRQPVATAPPVSAPALAAVAPAVIPAVAASTLPPTSRSRSAVGAPPVGGPAPAAVAGGGLHIQVGAFFSKAEADRRLADVQQQAGVLLANYPVASLHAISNGKTVFRARFTGVDPASAGSVCNELRRRNIDCMVAKAE